MFASLLISEHEYVDQQVPTISNEIIFEKVMRCGDIKTDDPWSYATKQVNDSIKIQRENAKQRYTHILSVLDQNLSIDTIISLAKIFRVYKPKE